MAELFIQIAVSLDGYIEGPDRDLSWFTGDDSFDQVATDTLNSIEGMIIGRRTYNMFVEFWPNAGEAPDASAATVIQAERMNALPKYVLTHHNDLKRWPGARPIALEQIAALKIQAARPLALWAGAQAAQAVMECGLAEELRLITYPVVLGSGTPLFPASGRRRVLQTLESRRFNSGAVLTRYRASAAPA